MSDEAVTQAAVNSGNDSAASASAESQGESTTPPAGEQPVVGNSEQRIPKQRFDQVVDQRNREREIRTQYENRIRELEQRQNGSVAQPSIIDRETERLVNKLGMNKDAAKELLESISGVAKAERGQVEQQLQRYEMQHWQEGLAAKYKDYRELEPKMAEIWNQMPQHEQMSVVSSPRQLEMLYHYAKSQNFDGAVDDARKQGAEQAYANKLAKQAVSSTVGASGLKPGGALNRKAIDQMSIEEYTRRRPEINAWLEKQR